MRMHFDQDPLNTGVCCERPGMREPGHRASSAGQRKTGTATASRTAPLPQPQVAASAAGFAALKYSLVEQGVGEDSFRANTDFEKEGLLTRTTETSLVGASSPAQVPRVSAPAGAAAYASSPYSARRPAPPPPSRSAAPPPLPAA